MQDLSLLLSKSRPRNVKTQDLTSTWQGGGVFCKAAEQHRVTGHFPEHRESVSSNMGLYLVFRLAMLSFSHERTKTFQRKSQLPTWNATKFRCQKFSFPTRKGLIRKWPHLRPVLLKQAPKPFKSPGHPCSGLPKEILQALLSMDKNPVAFSGRIKTSTELCLSAPCPKERPELTSFLEGFQAISRSFRK